MPKKCSACRLSKSDAEFSKSRREKDGLKRECKACAAIQRARFYQANKEREIAKTRAYEAANPAKAEEWQAISQERGRPRYNAQKRKRHLAVKDVINATNRVRYIEDAEYRADKLQRSADTRATQDPQGMAAYLSLYRRENRAALNVLSGNYRAKKAGSSGSMTSEVWQDILSYFNHCCAYCLKPEAEVGRLHQDHMQPLARGGLHEPANIVPACRRCNSSKNDSTPIEFIARSCGFLTLRPPRSAFRCSPITG